MHWSTIETVKLPDHGIRASARVLLANNIDPTPLIEKAGLSAGLLALPAGVVSGVAELKFQQELVKATLDRPDIWAAIGRNLSLTSMGGLASLSITAPTLRALSHVRSRMHMNITMARPALRSVRGRDCVFLHLDDCLPELHRFYGFRDVAGALANTPRLLGATALKTIVHVPKSVSYADYAEIFDADVILDSNQVSWSWPPGTVDLPLLFKDADAHSASLLAAENSVARPQSGVVIALCSILVRGHFCDDIASAAHQLKVSTRTLQRHLQVEGMSFRQISEEAKREEAIRLIRLGSISMTEIAWRLGYNDITGFSHAFKRWTGLSPRAFVSQAS